MRTVSAKHSRVDPLAVSTGLKKSLPTQGVVVKLSKVVAPCAVCAAFVLGPAIPSLAATTIERIGNERVKHGYPTDPGAEGLQVENRNWYHEDTRVGGGVELTDIWAGPQPDYGDGALALTTNNTDRAKAQLITHGHVYGTPLQDVTNLSYWTYQEGVTENPNGPPEANASFQLQIDTDGDLDLTTGFTTLVWEPYFNDGPEDGGTQPIAPDEWQFWEVTGGRWWSTREINCTGGDPDPFTLPAGAGGVSNPTTPAAVGVGCPAAKIVGIGVNVGTFNRNYVVGVDGITLSTATDDYVWDFGPK
jgi:hypothetical protein